MWNSFMLPEHCLNYVPPTTSVKSTNGGQKETDTDNVMCPERCYLFIIGKRSPGYANVGGVYTYTISEIQKLMNEYAGLQNINLVFEF